MPALRSYFSAGGFRPRFTLIDVVVLLAVLVLLYSILRVGSGTTASFSPSRLEHVSTDASRIPYDAARSLLRMFVALFFSFVFTLIYGYSAARSRRAEKVLIPILDILQSVPVLGFLTITVAVFVGLFPGNELGLELASIFAIFTAQAWNMTFSFYASLKSLPRELDELSRSLRLTKWQRFWKIEVANGAIGLVWNGMMSFGGAWFFLVASEAITLHGHNYSLPGIGSYVGAAIAKKQLGAVGLAIATMIIMVLAVNVLFWRPLVAWTERFRYETTEASETQRSYLLDIVSRSTWPRLAAAAWAKISEPINRAMRILGRDDVHQPVSARRRRVGDIIFWVVIGGLVAYGLYHGLHYIATAPGVGLGEIPHCVALGAATFARVAVLLVLATLVWVPIGVWIGLNPRVARLAQPLVQVLASFPANFLFPFATLAFIKFGISINIGGVLLMALGAQWYILFNVIAGASAIPSDLREAMQVLGVSGWQRWKRLIMPGILSAYVTGGITAAGGAWNASIVAEVVNYGHTRLAAYGLGAYIVDATDSGNKAKLICGIAVMAVYVVAVNRFFWRRLYRLAETRYSL
ncbi:MAG TPA: ABC transporter permease subunit [Solirubrobacteraceae bacterium]|nr:ABC transporter permease subunit [Solirubrobacteraceae bacterium]